MLLRLRLSLLTLQSTVASSHYDMRDALFCCCYFVSIILNWWTDMMKAASDDFWWSWEFHSCAVSKQNIFWILKLTSIMWIKIDLKCFFKYLPNRWCQELTAVKHISKSRYSHLNKPERFVQLAILEIFTICNAPKCRVRINILHKRKHLIQEITGTTSGKCTIILVEL